MKHLIAASILAMPFAAFAGPITPSYDVVDVEYWGTLNRFIGEPPPNQLHGVLRIDLSLAPPDNNALPSIGDFNWHNPGPCFVCPKRDTSDFVTNPLQPVRGTSADSVTVIDGGTEIPNAFDEFHVMNSELRTNPDGTVVSQQFTLSVFVPSDFVHGDRIAQSFDVTPPPGNFYGIGSVAEFAAGVRRLYSITVDRLRVTPRVCRI